MGAIDDGWISLRTFGQRTIAKCMRMKGMKGPPAPSPGSTDFCEGGLRGQTLPSRRADEPCPAIAIYVFSDPTILLAAKHPMMDYAGRYEV